MGVLARCREHAGTARGVLAAAALWMTLLLSLEALLTGSVPVWLQWLAGVTLSCVVVLAGEYVLGLQQRRRPRPKLHDSVSSWLDSPPASPQRHQQQQQPHCQPWSSSGGGACFTPGGEGVPVDAWPGSNGCSSSGASTVLHAVVAGLRPGAAPAAKGKVRRMSLRAPTQAYSEVAAHHGRVCLLCVDSNPIDQAVLHMLLDGGGSEAGKYTLSLAASGAEALEAVLSAQWLPDIVLLSSQLPDMRASEVCCQLRSMFSPLELPIILLSNRSGEADMLAALGEGGASDYLIKPLRRLELLARINNQMTIKQSVRREAESRSHYELLAQVLPPHIIQRLAAGQATLAPESHEEVTILFSDIVGFTQLCSLWPTADVVAMLDTLFSAFDDICDRHGVFKVETIGDAYMAVAGHDGSSDHTVRMVAMAVDMLAAAEETQRQLLAQGRDGWDTLQIRIGMHTGPAHSGVVGKRRPRYCFFGDTVNVASRMESSGWPGTVHLSDAAKAAACNQMMAAAARVAARSSLSGIPSGGRVCVGRSSTSSSRSSTSSLYDTPSQGGSSCSSTSVGSAVLLPWELVDLGISRVKGKGDMQTHLLRVGNWQAALAAVQAGQQQQHSGLVCASPSSTTTSDSSHLFGAKHTGLAAGAPLSLMGWLQGCGSQTDSDSWAIRAGQGVRQTHSSLTGGEGSLLSAMPLVCAAGSRPGPKMRRFSAVSFSGV